MFYWNVWDKKYVLQKAYDKHFKSTKLVVEIT